MAPKPSRRRRRGPPETSLREDPDRYPIVYYIARLTAFPVESETALARHIMQVHYSAYGDVGSQDEAGAFASAILEDRTVRLKPKRGEVRGHDDPTDKIWREQDWANARADNFRKKCRVTWKDLGRADAANRLGRATVADAENLYWFVNMMNAWDAILRPFAYADPLATARLFTTRAGETEYFEREMRPCLRSPKTGGSSMSTERRDIPPECWATAKEVQRARQIAAAAVETIEALRQAREATGEVQEPGSRGEVDAVDAMIERQEAAERERPKPPPKSTLAQGPPFPQPLKIVEKKYYRRAELDYFKRCLEARALSRPFPPKPPIPDGDPLVSHRKVAAEFDTTTRTIDRWVKASAEAVA
jgi:hypothetical protein